MLSYGDAKVRSWAVWEPRAPTREQAEQLVHQDRDARALGAALQRASPDVPEQDAFEHRATTPGGRGTSLERTLRRDVRRQASPLELYSGEEKEVLRSLIAHCHDCSGGFWIWSYESR